MLSSRARSSRNQLPAGRPGRPSLPGVAPRSVRTGLQSRVPALVPGTPARCSGLATQGPPVPRQPSHASSPGSQPRRTLGRGPLPLPGGLGAAGRCSPARWPSSPPRRLSPHLFSSPEAPEDRRWLPGGPPLLFLGPRRTFLAAPSQPSSCCSAAPFPLPKGRSGRDLKQNTRIGV